MWQLYMAEDSSVMKTGEHLAKFCSKANWFPAYVSHEYERETSHVT